MDQPITLEERPSILLTIKPAKIGTNRLSYSGEHLMHRLMLTVGTDDAMGRPPFHGVKASVQFNTPVHCWEVNYGADVPGGKRPPEICGIVTILAGLAHSETSTPVYARIGVPDRTFEALLANIDRAHGKDVKLHLVLEPLTPNTTDIELEKLDLSQERTYAVRNFQLMA